MGQYVKSICKKCVHKLSDRGLRCQASAYARLCHYNVDLGHCRVGLHWPIKGLETWLSLSWSFPSPFFRHLLSRGEMCSYPVLFSLFHTMLFFLSWCGVWILGLLPFLTQSEFAWSWSWISPKRWDHETASHLWAFRSYAKPDSTCLHET